MKFDNFMIYSDFDGTLTNHNGDIDNENIEAINYFLKNGGIFSLATGRNLNDFYSIPINVNGPLILSNGSQIYDISNKRWIKQFIISNDINRLLRDVYEYFSDIGIAIFTTGNTYNLRYNNLIKDADVPWLKHKILIDNLIQLTGKILLVCVYSDDIHRLKILQKYIEENYKDQFIAVSTYPGYINITERNVSKGNALNYLKENHFWGTKKRIIVAVGDNENDTELLQCVDIPFAMGNADNKLLKLTNNILKCNQYPCIPQIMSFLEKY